MPAKDRYHNQVRNALIQDGWLITDDPLRLWYGKRDMYVDLGAQRLLAAEKDGKRIAVEVKSFTGVSEMRELENALGQFILYQQVMKTIEPERRLFMAVSDLTYDALFDESIGKLLIDQKQIRLLVFNPDTEEIIQWIS